MKYTEYSEETQSFMKSVERQLKKKYGTLGESWDLSFKLLADNLELYNKCKKSVEEEGIYNKEKKLKNPLLSTMKDTNSTILNFLKQFGLTAWSESKIKKSDEDDCEDFIDNLINT